MLFFLFQLMDWVANKANKAKSAYLQWKPVCYTQPGRSIKDVTKAKQYQVHYPAKQKGTSDHWVSGMRGDVGIHQLVQSHLMLQKMYSRGQMFD